MAEVASSRCQLRSPQRRSNHATASNYPAIPRRIRFLHPSYRRNQNILFEMLAPDSSAGGLHHRTARTACAIIAGNRWDGFLSRTATGQAIDAGEEAVLVEDEYFFIVPGPPLSPTHEPSSSTTVAPPPPPYIYPVVPGFKQWTFPHGQLPAAWQEVDIEVNNGGRMSSDAIAMRDVSCRMTAYSEECDTSHLCPQSETQWYQENRMDQYRVDTRKAGRQAINDACNVMLLRADLHRAWDKMRFVHVPKQSAGKMEFVTHLLNHSPELGELYHNAKLHRLGVARECLFARFAWAVFPLLSGFLQQGLDRYLLRAESDEGEYVHAEECFQYGDSWKPANQRGSRPPSPTKRSADDAGFVERRFEMNAAGNNEERMDDVRQARRIKRPRYALRASTDAAHHSPSMTKPSSKRTTPDLIISQSDSSKASTSERKEDVDGDPVLALYDAGLKAERARSDPDRHWEKHAKQEQEWLDGVFQHGGAVDAREMSRFIRAWGQDVVEDEQRLCCVTGLEGGCEHVG